MNDGETAWTYLMSSDAAVLVDGGRGPEVFLNPVLLCSTRLNIVQGNLCGGM